jgi:acetyl-CoA carboxylase biotin carboxylase subunit
MIRRVLIANRGEIARRVIRTCREMGIASVAVYSEADAGAPHVREADEAIAIGAAPSTESYLNISRVVDASRRARADAVHPGYGFLSENAAFAEACEAAGLIFVGPPASVMRRLGSKTGARALMAAAGVPVVPGATPRSQEDADIGTAVADVGFPALLKASGGGGGKGMRAVRAPGDVKDAIGAARREAERSFGNGALYVERLIERPRHIEVQIFGDGHGHLVHLFERDCTLQRRHQKVIEEAPAPIVTAAVRERLTAAALAAARAAGYVNAGTVEFLLEGEGDSAAFYFLEINMRLQVEHPVTEAITGLDLVRAQLLVAAGEPLPFSQADVRARGHAIECRVYAEDSRRLLPQAGRLVRYREPQGAGIRVDSGVTEGQTVTVHYDPLLAKLIAHGATRQEAIDRMRTALRQYEILGLRHNLAFLRTVLDRDEVRTSRLSTTFLEDHLDALAAEPSPEIRRAAAAFAAFAAGNEPAPAGPPDADAESPARLDPWDQLGTIAW